MQNAISIRRAESRRYRGGKTCHGGMDQEAAWRPQLPVDAGTAGSRHHCAACLENTAQHKLEECPAWAGLRRNLIVTIGGSDVYGLRSIDSPDRAHGTGLLSLAQDVMYAKEVADRERETASLPFRRRRTGPEKGAKQYATFMRGGLRKVELVRPSSEQTCLSWRTTRDCVQALRERSQREMGPAEKQVEAFRGYGECL